MRFEFALRFSKKGNILEARNPKSKIKIQKTKNCRVFRAPNGKTA
jgi:hypothetical protein